MAEKKRPGVVRVSYVTAPGKQTHFKVNKKKIAKQVSEVDEQGADSSQKIVGPNTGDNAQVQVVAVEPTTTQQCAVTV